MKLNNKVKQITRDISITDENSANIPAIKKIMPRINQEIN